MTIETIKDVLGRILAINKNLTEESLRTLLDASGWDASDISEGLRIFREYMTNGQDMSKIDVSGRVNTVGQSAIHNSIKSDIQKSVHAESAEVTTPEKVSEKLSNPADAIIDLTRDKDEVSQINNEAATNAAKLEEEKKRLVEEINRVKTNNSSNALNTSVELPPVIRHIESPKDFSPNVHSEEDYSRASFNKSLGLIVFNSVLFFIVLFLLIYILLK